MPDPLKGVKVDGVEYHFDHDYLENNPIPAYDCQDHIGKVLTVDSSDGDNILEWRTVEADYMPVYDTQNGLGKTLRLATCNGEFDLEWYGTPVPESGDGDLDKLLVSSINGPVWESIESSLGITSACDGDVLTVSESQGVLRLAWMGVSSGDSLPLYDRDLPSTDEGKVLTINDSAELGWERMIPVYGTHDVGSVLTVAESLNGECIEWAEPQRLPQIPMNGTAHSPYVLNADKDTGEVDWTEIRNMLADDIATYSSDLAYYIENGRSAYSMAQVDGDVVWLPLWGCAFEYFRLLPTDSSDPLNAEKFLMTTGSDIIWEHVLPPHDSNDAGKVLTVASNGAAVWRTPV